MRVQVREKTRPQARDRPLPAARTRSGAITRHGEAGSQQRDAQRSVIWYTDASSFEDLTCQGYTTLAASPEVVTAVNTIARLVGAMTIHKMQHTKFETDRGSVPADVRVWDDMSRLVDIEPNRYMSRANFIQWIVRTLYLEGHGNAVVFPRTERGEIRELVPIPSAWTALYPLGLWDYRIAINGREYDPADLLHFVLNPGSYYPWRGGG